MLRFYEAWEEALKKAAQERPPVEEVFDTLPDAPPLSPHDIHFWRLKWTSGSLAPGWRQEAEAAGLCDQEINGIAFWIDAFDAC